MPVEREPEDERQAMADALNALDLHGADSVESVIWQTKDGPVIVVWPMRLATFTKQGNAADFEGHIFTISHRNDH